MTRMTKEEAYRLAMRACEETWNEKTCKQIKEALEQEPFMNKLCVAHQVCHEDKVKVLDEIRAEIIDKYMTATGEVNTVAKGCLQIIDKYRVDEPVDEPVDESVDDPVVKPVDESEEKA